MEILAIEGLTKNFYLHNLGKTIKSCRDIGFTLHEGEFIGIVGRSDVCTHNNADSLPQLHKSRVYKADNHYRCCRR